MPKLAEIMSREVATAAPETTITDAAKQMVRGGFGSIVIMQGSWIAGIFTERDALRAAAAGVDPAAAAVSDWMTKDPETASPEVDVDEAAQIMVTHGFRHLPVVDGKEVAGIVSLRDILSARIRRSG